MKPSSIHSTTLKLSVLMKQDSLILETFIRVIFPKKRHQLFQRCKNDKRFSVAMAIHCSGVIHSKIQTTPFNKASFREFIETILPMVPLNTKAVIMDNVAFHRSNDILKLFQDRGIAVLFIPPYSPRCNPIEEVFAFAKRHFRHSDKQHFADKVSDAIEKTKGYKHISKHYQHTRSHVQTTCQEL